VANSKGFKPEARRILVMRYRFIGDTILTVPFLRNLRENYPGAVIDVLVGPKSGEVLKNCPYVDELIAFDTTRFHKYDSGEGKPRSLLSYASELRARKYDLVFVLKRSFSAALLAFLSGAKRRVGYAGDGRFLLTDQVKWRTDIHEVDSLLSVLEAVSIEVGSRELASFSTKEEVEAVIALEPRLAQKNLVLIHAAAAHPDKLYPQASWQRLISRLAGEGLTPVFSGDKQDEALYAELSEVAPQAINMAGRLDLRGSMAMYTLMDLAVCTDSGPSHLAASAGVPTLTLFGPTDPVRWRPYGALHQAVYDAGLSCRPCHYKKTCQRRECLTELSPDVIFDKCLNIRLNAPGR
jgi:heptosyltransferase II